MRSENVIRVILKNDKLRKIRRNLRDLLKCAFEDKLKQLLREISECRKNGNEEKMDIKIKEHGNLISAKRSSTLGCGDDSEMLNGKNYCVSIQKARELGLDEERTKSDLDLVWIPILRQWICTECVKVYDWDNKDLWEELEKDSDVDWRELLKA
ncbi:MAG: hypothetical protein BAJALOKI2v1_270002 [Promethearchaeota archaeon]|nr:MAG: hypothetical protein BAJALOKI2v1_270002 [Candidatus Lokiarchaeota archaeon]